MARSPLTLAAAVTSALPRVGVVGVAGLTEGTSGRFDSAVADLDDGRRAVVRVATSDTSSADLSAEIRSLRALTPGVRALLPFAAPELYGDTEIDGRRAAVVGFLAGYRVEAAHVPAGLGFATALGDAIASVHDLPTSVIREAGLPAMSAEGARDDLSRLLDRVTTTHRIPVALLSRWSRAVAADRLWRFESTVVLGGVGPEAFVFGDEASIVGLLEWRGLAIGDPAVDLRWLSAAPVAAADVYDAYARAAHRAPDAAVRTRARLYAELEFAKWLLHGVDQHDETVVDDAVSLLESLAESVRGEDLANGAGLDPDDAIALIGQTPATSTAPIDTSMQTDAYDPATLSFLDADDAPSRTAEIVDPTPAPAPADADDTAPIELSDWVGAPGDQAPATRDHAAEAEDSAEAALRRWASAE